MNNDLQFRCPQLRGYEPEIKKSRSRILDLLLLMNQSILENLESHQMIKLILIQSSFSLTIHNFSTIDVDHLTTHIGGII